MSNNKRFTVYLIITVLVAAFTITLLPFSPVSAADTDVWRQSAGGGFEMGDSNLLAGPIVEHDGSVYSATAGENGLMVYKKTGTGWEAASTAGFGDTGNMAALGLKSFGGNLYAGTVNLDGCEIWRHDGGTAWTQVIGEGFDSTGNIAVGSMEVFEGKLYVGLINYNASIDPLNFGSAGSEIWSFDGTSWELESDSDGGFGDVENVGILGLKVYDGELYATTLHFSISYNIFNSTLKIHSKGWELWQKDAGSWNLVDEETSDHEATKNIGIMAMETFDDELYMGTINLEADIVVNLSTLDISSITLLSDGSEVLKYDGMYVTPVMQGGFGDTSKAILSMCTTESAGSEALLATSCNVTGTGLSDLSANGIIKSSFNGSSWSDISTEGFGNPDNMLIFSLLNDSGNNTYAGTVNIENGCEVWWWPEPSLTSITPNEGITGETISGAVTNGENLDQIAEVYLAETSHTVEGVISTPTSDDEIVADFDLTGAPAGIYDLVVIDHLGKNATLADAFTVNNPVPEITSIDPSSKTAGEDSFTLTVNGSGFVDGSEVSWNGNPKSTEYINNTQLTSSIPASDIADGGTFYITVFNSGPGGGESNSQTFTVNNPVPSITSINPTSKIEGEVEFDLTVTGTGFLPSSKVMWNSTERDTTYVDSTELNAKITAYDISSAGIANVTVFNTAPSGGESNVKEFTINKPAPVITSISPTSGGYKTDVTIKGANFGSSRGGSIVKFGSDACDASDYTSWSDTEIEVEVPYIEEPPGTYPPPITVPVTVTTVGGTSNSKNFEVLFSPKPGPLTFSQEWYLAEGTTDWGFDTYISVLNPNDEEVNIEVTYMTGNGPVDGGTHKLPPMSQLTINPSDTLSPQDFSTKVECTDNLNIAVDRTMTWTGEGAASPDGHCSVGVIDPNKIWYLAEGSSNWGFECWLLIQNPNDEKATAKVTYMIEGEEPQEFTKEIAANSRQSYSMADDIGAKDASIKVESDIDVIPERAMYRNNRREGHDSIGTTTPAEDYYLAEGATGYGPGFVTWVLVQNPNNEPANVDITYLTSSGEVTGPTMNMPANSRWTVKVNDYLPDGSDVSTHVHGDKPIIAERAMYWNNGLGEACHDSIGLPAPHGVFYLPDGETSRGRETWTLVQNPNDSDAEIRVTYLTPDGTGNKTFTDTIPAKSRKTYNMADEIINGRAAILVQSTTENRIMVERAMYWNNRGAGTDTIGGSSFL